MSDPLSDWLALVGARCSLSGSLVATGPWSVRFQTDSTKISVVASGSAWLMHAGLPAPLRLHAGDGFMLTRPGTYVLCSDPALTPQEASAVFESPHARVEGGGMQEFRAIGCRIDIDVHDADLLHGSLPAVVVVGSPAGVGSERLRWLIEQLTAEDLAPTSGSTASTDLMAQLLFVEVIRYWQQHGAMESGYLHALRDPRIAAALRLLHGEPARPWQLASLAHEVGMSRSAFAARFKELLGKPPLDYLLGWRMRLAARAIRRGEPLAHVATATGYQSDSAFSHAFKRCLGLAPSEYRKQRRAARAGH